MIVSIPEQNGPTVSMPLEIKLNAVHAGLSLLQRPSQIDSVLPQVDRPTLSFQLKTSSLATRTTMLAKEVTLTLPGNILRRPVPQLTAASHTSLVVVQSHLAPKNAKMVQPLKSISASLVLPKKLKVLLKSRV
jgi:hypothetical protein